MDPSAFTPDGVCDFEYFNNFYVDTVYKLFTVYYFNYYGNLTFIEHMYKPVKYESQLFYKLKTYL